MSKIKQEKEKIIKELQQYGVSSEHADIVADCFVTADSYGVTSHGTAILPSHIKRIKDNGYNLNPQIKVIRETAAFAVIA